MWREPGSFVDGDFFRDLYSRFVPSASDADDGNTGHQVTLTDVLTLRAQPTLTPSAVPLEGQGRLASSIRVEVDHANQGEASRIRRMHVPDAMSGLFELIDGRTSLLELADAYQTARGIDAGHRESLERYILWIGQSLIDRDLATLTTGQS